MMKKIHITSTLHGIEIAGMRHPNRTVTYTEDQITDEQLAEFQASPYLTVEIDGEPQDTGATDADSASETKPVKAAKTK